MPESPAVCRLSLGAWGRSWHYTAGIPAVSKSEAFAEDPAVEIQTYLQEQRFWNKGCNLSVYYQENHGGLQSKHMFRQGWISTKVSWSIWEGKSKSLSDFDHNVFQLLKHHISVFYHTHIYKHFMMHFLNIKDVVHSDWSHGNTVDMTVICQGPHYIQRGVLAVLPEIAFSWMKKCCGLMSTLLSCCSPWSVCTLFLITSENLLRYLSCKEESH